MHFWIAMVDGTDVGFGECHRDVGSYHPLKWTTAVCVLPEFRERGVGAQLYERAMAFVDSQQGISVTSRVLDTEPESLGFAGRRGFSEAKRDFESVLELEKVDPASLRVVECDGIEIVAASTVDSDDFRRAWHELFEVVRVDTPRAEPPTRMSFEQFDEIVLSDTEFSWDASQVAFADGILVGFSGIYRTDVPSQLWQWLTAVRRDFRGKGVAKALKAKGALWAIDHGYKTIRTDNDTRNGPMLAINKWLGYRPLVGTITLIKPIPRE